MYSRPCAKHGKDVRLISLWDGNEYCGDCLVTASSDLMLYRESHDAIEFTIHRRQVVSPCAWRVACLAALVLLFGLSLTTDRVDMNQQAVLYCQCVSAIYLVFYSLMEIRFNFKRLAAFPRHVSISKGEVKVETPWRNYTANLKDCWWFVGDSKQDRDGELFRRKRALVLHLPGNRMISVTGNERFMSVCRAFLTVARVSHLPDRDSRHETILFLTCATRGAARIGLVGMGVGALLATIVDRPPLQPIVAQWIAASLCGVCLGRLQFIVQRRPHFPTREAWALPTILCAQVGWVGTLLSGVGASASFLGMAFYVGVAVCLTWLVMRTRPST